MLMLVYINADVYLEFAGTLCWLPPGDDFLLP